MARLIQVSTLWQDGKLTIPGCPISLRCDSFAMGSLRWGWLVPAGQCDSEFELSYTAPGAAVQGVLQGAVITLTNDSVAVLNVESLNAIKDACWGCCGDSPVVALHYTEDYHHPALVRPPSGDYCFLRTDRGDWQAMNKAMMDYYGQYDVNTFTRFQRSATQSLYCFTAPASPAFLASDTPTGAGGAPLFIYMSNVASPLSFGQIYSLSILGAGPEIVVAGSSLQQIVEILATDPTYGALSFGIKDNRITLATTATGLSLVITNIHVGENLFVSNEAPVSVPPDLYLLTATVNGNAVLPPLYGETLQDIIEAMAGYSAYAGVGTWYVEDNKIVLAALTATTATLVVTGSIPPAGRSFVSNAAPTLLPENTYSFTVIPDGTAITPPLTGDSIALLMAAIAATPAYNDLGVWTSDATTITLTPDGSSTVINFQLIISQVAKPAFILQSNAAPTLVADQQYVLNANLDLADLTPPLTDTTLAGLVSQATATAPYSDKGTWSVVGDKIQLSSLTVEAGELDLTAAYLYESNDSIPLPPNPSSIAYRFYMDVDNTGLTAYVNASLATIVVSLNLDPDYQAFGQYVVIDGKIVLLATDTHPEVTLVLQNAYASNQATLAGGQIFRFTPTVNSTPHGPYTSTALTNIATMLRGTSGYDGIHPVEPNDFWIGASGYMGLNSALVTGTPTLLLEAITATWEYVSNDPGAPGGGESLALDGSINEATFTQAVAADVTAMVTFLNANAPFNLYGTWTADGVAGVKLTPNATTSTSVQTAIAADLVMSIITTPAEFVARQAPDSLTPGKSAGPAAEEKTKKSTTSNKKKKNK